MSMKNYNMARYYAWSNLSQFIKKTYRKHFFTPYYRYQYIQPQVHPDFMLNPFHKWKANQQRENSHDKIVVISIAFLSFFMAKFVYQVLEDEDMGYYYHVNYPVLCKIIEALYADIEEATLPFFQIMPKDKYQITQIYPRLYELIFKTTQKIQEKDKKVLQLRKEIEEYDRTHQ